MKAKFSYNSKKTDIKIERGDTYNIDSTIAHIVLPLLLEYKQNLRSYPSSFNAGVGSDFDRNYCFDFINSIESAEYAEKQWHEVIDKMIWAFYQLIAWEYEDKYYHGDWSNALIFHKQDPVTGSRAITVNKNSNHWVDKAGQRLHEERIQEGLDLFGKYLRKLWT